MTRRRLTPEEREELRRQWREESPTVTELAQAFAISSTMVAYHTRNLLRTHPDAEQRGRVYKKLTFVERRELRRRWEEESVSTSDLAREFGVTRGTVAYHTRNLHQQHPKQLTERSPRTKPQGRSLRRTQILHDWEKVQLSVQEIAEKHGITIQAVRYHVGTSVIRPLASAPARPKQSIAQTTIRVALRPQGGAHLYIGRWLWQMIGVPARVDLTEHTGSRLLLVPGQMYAMINTDDGLMPRISVPRQIVGLLGLEHNQRFQVTVRRTKRQLVVHLRNNQESNDAREPE